MAFDPNVIGAVIRAARAHNLDPAAMLATAYAESGLRPGAVNPSSGASGLFQFLPSTWQGMHGTGPMTDPTQNANLAALGMAQAGAGGLTGQAALQKMISGFERPGPAGVQSDLGRALPFMANVAPGLLGGVHGSDASASTPGVPPPSGGAGAPSLGGSLSPGALGAFMRYLTQTQQQVAAGKAPTDPFSSGLLQKLLAGVRSGGGVQQPAEMPSGGGAPPGTINIGGLIYPLPKQAQLIGRPYQGTHTLYGNWQSDRAWDLEAAPNTPVYAVTGGTIDPRFGALNQADPHLAGLRLTLDAPGNAYYYQHLKGYAPGIKPGVKVTPGQLLGYTGALNHLHFAAQSGDPFGLPGLPAGR